jgi:hypothetical protein
VWLDGVAVSTVPVRLPLDPGDHWVSVVADGGSGARRITVRPGANLELDPEELLRETRAIKPRPDGAAWVEPAGFALLGSGLALLAVSVGTSIGAYRIHDGLECEGSVCTPQDRTGRYQSMRAVAAGTLYAGIAVGVAGGGMLLVPRLVGRSSPATP